MPDMLMEYRTIYLSATTLGQDLYPMYCCFVVKAISSPLTDGRTGMLRERTCWV